MSYRIQTWLEGTEPRLGVVDTRSGRLCQLWRLEQLDPRACQHAATKRSRYMQIPCVKQLIHGLFILGCVQEIAARSEAGSEQRTGACPGKVVSLMSWRRRQTETGR